MSALHCNHSHHSMDTACMLKPMNEKQLNILYRGLTPSALKTTSWSDTATSSLCAREVLLPWFHR